MAQAQTKETAYKSPLHELSAIMASDMARVDAIITERMQSPVPLIPKLAEYLIAAGGKRIRPLLTLASASLHGEISDDVCKLAAAVEFIHTATLLHDDVVDESDQRRGKKAANLVFGNKASVLVGDYLFSRAFELMTETNSLLVLKSLSNASAVIAQGEVLQLTTTGNLDTTFETYLEVINAKTAVLFSAACEVAPLLTQKPQHDVQAMSDYGTYLGIAFQIADDALDYAADSKTLGKDTGDDFREGKMTAPVLIALENASDEERKFWIRTLQNLKINDGDFEQALSILERHDAVAKATDKAQTYGQQAKDALENLPQTHIKSLLVDLIDYTIHRKA